MRFWQWTITRGVVLVFSSLSVSAADVQADKKITDHFTVTWSAITYNKTVTIRNSKVSSGERQAAEGLNLSCEITIREPNLVLGISPSGVVTRLTDHRGRDIDVNEVPSRGRQSYQGLHYVPGFTQPPQQPRWERLLRTLVKLPKNQNFRPQWVTELQPSHLEIELGKGLLDGAGGEIRRVTGHFHALLAERLEVIEVPFEPNDKWVRLTPDLEIQVREASSTESSFTYNIATRSQMERPLFGLPVGDPLPNRLVVGQEILGAQGNALPSFRMHSPSLPAHIGGIGSGSGPGGPMRRIQFTIAVNLRDYEVPFELKDIPLPHP